MTGSQGRVLTALAILLVGVGVDAATNSLSECSRVIPGPVFPRVQVVDDETVWKHALVGENGEQGLLFVRSRPAPVSPPLTRFYLQSGIPNDSDSLKIGEEIDLPEIDLRSIPHTLLTGDFDGDGAIDGMLYWARSFEGRMALDFFKGQEGGRYAPGLREDLGSGRPLVPPLIGDFDNDGKSEVAVFLTTELRIFGIADHGFSLEFSRPAPRMTDAVVVDWNEDDVDDIAIQSNTNTVRFLLGSAVDPLTREEAHRVDYSILDLSTQDDKLLALEGERIWFSWTTDAIHLLQRGGPEPWVVEMPENSGWIRPPLDLDGDGLQELMFGEQWHFFYGGTSGFQIFWGESNAAPTRGPSSFAQTHLVASLDLNGDSVRDWITSDFGVVIRPSPREAYEGLYATEIDSGGQIIDEPNLSVAVGDLNGDGLDDVLLESSTPSRFHSALSLGDAHFEIIPLDALERDFRSVRLLDLDADGHLDLVSERGSRSVAWGRGDGTFGPYDLGAQTTFADSRRYGTLNQDSHLDRVELLCVDFQCRSLVLRTAVGAGRILYETPFTFESPSREFTRAWAIADLDSDGLDDLVMNRILPAGGAGTQLVWRRSLGDGSFGEEFPVIDRIFSGGLDRIVPTDFDLDGRTDLFLTPRNSTSPYVSVRAAARGGFEIVWTGSATYPMDGVKDRLYDVDGDGRPDLVAGQYNGLTSPLYRTQIRRGDGLGGFLPVEPTIWSGGPGPPGVFRRKGVRDLVRLMRFSTFRLSLELLPSNGWVLPRDIAPPTVDIGITPADEESHWRVTTVPLDECDDKPRIVRRAVEMLPARLNPEPSFRRAEQFEIRIYEVPGGKRRDVLLLGPDKSEAKTIYEAAVADRGVSFESFDVLEFGIDHAHADERGPTIRGSRLAQRFVFTDGHLAAAFASRPGADLTVAADAVDRAGRVGTTSVSLMEVIGTGANYHRDK